MTIPAPSSVRQSLAVIGASYVTADGAMHLDRIGYRKRFAVTWEQATTAERDEIRGYLVGGVSFSLVVPGDTTYTVVPVRGKYKHSPTGGISQTWTVSGEVEATT
jgi:hypothetical protein